MTARTWSLVLGVLVGSAASPHPAVAQANARPHGVRTMLEEGTEYLQSNDVLRALDGSREMDGAFGIARFHLYGEELSVLDGSRLVRGRTQSWTLPAPVRFRNGQVWVPRAFLERIVEPLAPVAIHYEEKRLFVGFTPGRVESVSVDPLFDGREVTILGRFPVAPTLAVRGRAIEIRLAGCIGPAAEYPGDDVVPAISVREALDGLVLTVEVGEGVTGYTWRERSDDRLRLLLGDEPKGLVALDPTPGTAPRRVSRIVIDPARGGSDLGASLGGVREKWLTLELARVVADSLLAAGYDVFLTRNEDRDLTPSERAETANGWSADLFLSLSFDTYPSAATPDVRCVVHRPVAPPAEGRVAAGYRLFPWEQAQRVHVQESLSLARWIGRGAPSADPTTEPLRIPSRLLEGLDMPAVEILIAAGVAERGPWRFWRERFAHAVADGIESYAGRTRMDRRAEREPRRRRRF